MSSRIGASLSIDLTAFYQRLLLTDLNSMFNIDPNDERLLELRDGESYGLEVMIRRAPSQRLFGWLSYTLSWSQRLVGAARAKAWSDWDQRAMSVSRKTSGSRRKARARWASSQRARNGA